MAGQWAPARRGRRRLSDRRGSRWRATQPEDAAQVVSAIYLPVQVRPEDVDCSLEMDLVVAQLGTVTAGRVSYGCPVRVVADETVNFHVNIPLRGHATSQSDDGPEVTAGPGRAVVFPPEAPATTLLSQECEQLYLMVPKETLERHLERLIGRTLDAPLSFDFDMDLREGAGRAWRGALQLVSHELVRPSGLVEHSGLARHLESLVVDGLLLAQPHNYRESLARAVPSRSFTPVDRAVELLEELPAEPWTTVSLASEVHLSVRALQEGFARKVGVAPMTYLRTVRLQRVHERLVASRREEATVREVALAYGFLHPGRFAASYRAAFGEPPSETLGRDPD
jgi:AraC-like DNA-binding protein